jgi:putative PIN family toxin of toxin-antitoxin system
MKYYAVIDTNVIVSAMLKTNSIPSRVMAEALKGDIIPILNDDIIAEYEDVLSRSKFHFEQKAVQIFLDELKKRAVYSEQGIFEDVIPDSGDVVFYAVLMEKRKEEEAYLVTGNLKHFPVRSYVVTPREMLDIIEKYKIR